MRSCSQYEMERWTGELEIMTRAAGDASRVWLLEFKRRATLAACRHCWPLRGTTSTNRAPQPALPAVYFMLATPVQS